VLEAREPAEERARIGAAHGLGGPRAQDREHGRDAALDRADVAEGEARREQPHDLAVGVRRLGPDELQRIGVDEPVVVLKVEAVERLLQSRAAHAAFHHNRAVLRPPGAPHTIRP
jgi:hypothetical protein